MTGMKKKWIYLIMSFVSLMGIAACENELGISPSQPEERQVTVSLSLGFADEEDGYTAAGGMNTRSGDASQDDAFCAQPVPVVRTRGDGGLMQPDHLYELRILQYDSGGTLQNSQSFSGATDIGKKLTVTLNASDDCQLVIVACGKNNASLALGNSISDLQKLTLEKSYFDAIPTDGSTSADGVSINRMPYILHLPHVKVTDAGIQSVEGAHDARLLLRRLAAKVTVAWNNNLTDKDYVLKEVRFCQVPAVYRFFPAAAQSEWGMTYPSAIVEFIDYFRLTDEADLSAGSKTLWMPANARGISAAASSSYYRTKENAPDAASYAEVVVDNATKNERLYYRAYLGGDASTDFNLLENTDYAWTLNINSTNYRGDGRILLLDQTPVISTNLVPTSNCLMMLPGTNICFNPYKHEAGTNGWNTYLTDGATLSAEKTIDHVRVLWQTKDTGTSGELVMGYVVGSDNHTNLVNVSDIEDKDRALVHVKVPVTKGGNALIAAYGSNNKIIWSWHIWISEYVPAGTDASKIIDEITREAAISAARIATQGGTVQTYAGGSWTDSSGAFYKKVIMDRNLGAVKAGIQTNMTDAIRTFGLLYQGGRKDPFFSTADGTNTDTKTFYDGNGMALPLQKSKLTNITSIIENPFVYSIGMGVFKWEDNGKKTILDPCPKGWRIPVNDIDEIPDKLGQTSQDRRKGCMWAGFGSTDPNEIYERVQPKYDNVMYYDAETGTLGDLTQNVAWESSAVGSGYVYFGTQAGSESGDKEIFFPAVALREQLGEYRVYVKNNAVFLWSSTSRSNGFQHYQIQPARDMVTKYIHIACGHAPVANFGFSVRCIQE